MQRTIWLAASVVAVLSLSLLSPGEDQRATASAAGGKSIKLKLLLPQDDAEVKVDGKEIPGNGTERKITVATAKDNDYVVITACWEPNNYTKITRPRKVTAKDGEITVDCRKPSDKEKDDIVVRFVPTPQEF